MVEHGADRSVDAVEDHFVSAMESYFDAADCLPDDDLNHPCKSSRLLFFVLSESHTLFQGILTARTTSCR